MNDSDLPYVRSGSGLERANPVVSVEMTVLTNLSSVGGAANVSTKLFPAADESVCVRSYFNIDDVAEWLNIFGGPAVVDGIGCMPVNPGCFMSIPTRGQVKRASTKAAHKSTAYQG